MKNIGGSNRMLTVKEMAVRLNVKPGRIHDCWRTWGIPMHRIGNNLRSRERDFDIWLDAQRIQTGS